MPWKVERRGNSSKPWKIIKLTTEEVVGSSRTKADAEASIRARYASIKDIKRKK